MERASAKCSSTNPMTKNRLGVRKQHNADIRNKIQKIGESSRDECI